MTDNIPWEDLGKGVDHPFDILAKELFKQLLPEYQYSTDFAMAMSLKAVMGKIGGIDRKAADEWSIRLRSIMTPYLIEHMNYSLADIERTFPI